MANNIKIKRSSVDGKSPTTTDLELGELAINTYNGKLFLKKDDGSETIVDVGSSPFNLLTKTSNYTASKNDRIMTDTSTAAFTLTLPSSPLIWDTIEIWDAGGTHQTNNLTISRNGNNILGLASDFVCDVENAKWTLIYYNTSEGWKINN